MRPFDTVDMLFGQVCCRSECGCEPARGLTHYRYRTLTDGFGNLDFASIKETTDIHGSRLDADLGNVACIFTPSHTMLDRGVTGVPKVIELE